jgi:hypothetical protein
LWLRKISYHWGHSGSPGKSQQTLTPDYMHRHASAASAEMD